MAMALFARVDMISTDASNTAPVVVEVRFNQYFQVATVTILIYEAIITIDKQARYFGKFPRRTVDFVYFFNRYIGIFGAAFGLYYGTFNPNPMLCKPFDWVRHLTNWLVVVLLDYILMIRVLALYSQGSMLSKILKALLALETRFKLGMVIYLEQSSQFVIGELANGTTLCAVGVQPPWRWVLVDWIIPAAYGTVLMALALRGAIEYWRISTGFDGSTLVKVLLRDQILYFMLAIICSMLNIVGSRVFLSDPFLENVLQALGNPSWLSILGSRMLFNLKEAGERGENAGTSHSVPSNTVSDMDFADPDNQQRKSEAEETYSAGPAVGNVEA